MNHFKCALTICQLILWHYLALKKVNRMVPFTPRYVQQAFYSCCKTLICCKSVMQKQIHIHGQRFVYLQILKHACKHTHTHTHTGKKSRKIKNGECCLGKVLCMYSYSTGHRVGKTPPNQERNLAIYILRKQEQPMFHQLVL